MLAALWLTRFRAEEVSCSCVQSLNEHVDSIVRIPFCAFDSANTVRCNPRRSILGVRYFSVYHS